jgi:HK97 gp10 family phage protein
MSSQQIKIVGFQEIIKKLESMPKKMAEKLERRALRTSLKELATMVESKAPIDDGELKASIKVQVKKKRGELVGSVLADSPHAHLVEYGHKVS